MILKILQGKKWIAGISMRQQQNNNNNKNRMRGRGRNLNNKQSNSLNRNYESNGPDVKIRGNAAHIAEKYTTLARDALSSGDRVVAENYLQHAEHYNRIVAAANAQREEMNAAQAANNRNNDIDDNDDDDQPDLNIASNNNDESDGNEQGGQNKRQPRRREPRNSNRNNNRNDYNGNGAAEAGDHDSGEMNENPIAAEKAVADDGQEQAKPTRAPRARRTSRKKEEAPEGVSADAAALPQGLIGG